MWISAAASKTRSCKAQRIQSGSLSRLLPVVSENAHDLSAFWGRLRRPSGLGRLTQYTSCLEDGRTLDDTKKSNLKGFFQSFVPSVQELYFSPDVSWIDFMLSWAGLQTGYVTLQD